MGELSPWHWAIVLVVVLLLVGSKKLPEMARGLGQSMRILRAETRAMAQDEPGRAPATPDERPDERSAPTAGRPEPDAGAHEEPTRHHG